LHHSTSSIPYPRFTKIIIGHYMTNFPEISSRAQDKYHNLKDDDVMKNIFNSGRYKYKVGMKIPAWMISEAMKHTEYYRMYAEVFGIDVPLTQSQPTESTKNDEHNIPSTRLEPMSDKESPNVEFTDVVIPVNVNEEEEEHVKEQVPEQVRDQVPVYVAKGLIMERQKNKEEIKKLIAKAILQERGNIQAQTSLQIQKVIANDIPSQVDAILRVPQTTCRTSIVRPRDQDDPHDDAHPGGRTVQSGRRHLSIKHMYLESDYLDRIIKRNKVYQLQQVSQDIMEEVSLTIDEAKLKKIIDEMSRQRWLLWSLSLFIKSSMIWERVHDFQLGIKSYQQKVNLIAPTLSFLGIEKHKMFSIIYELVHGIIYKNSKKKKKVMRHSEIHMFCDATLNKVLEGLKSYNNDVKYGYIQKDLTKDEAEYLKLFEE
nr:hypothetical protein [Tanacetum cinerariifolium]